MTSWSLSSFVSQSKMINRLSIISEIELVAENTWGRSFSLHSNWVWKEALLGTLISFEDTKFSRWSA